MVGSNTTTIAIGDVAPASAGWPISTRVNKLASS
jgi:hypothetical protein